MATLLHGFTDLKDLVNQRVNTSENIPVVDKAYRQSIEQHNAMMNMMISLFVQPTLDFKIRYRSPFAPSKLQPLDEHGRARKTKSAGYYEVAFPIRDAGAAMGSTFLANAKMTLQESNDRLVQVLEADKRWVRDNILAALFNNTSYTFDDVEKGDLTVKGLANGDSTVYLVKSGAEAGTTADHYRRVNSNTIVDGNAPFETIRQDLKLRPENAGGGEIIVFTPTNLTAGIRALTNFIEKDDEDIQRGSNVDKLTGTLNTPVVGEVLGKCDGVWLVEWDALPSGYMIALSTGGDKPVAMRQHEEAELQGLIATGERNDTPYFERQFQRHAGFGGWNRVGAIIYQFASGSTTYSIPTGLGVYEVL